MTKKPTSAFIVFLKKKAKKIVRPKKTRAFFLIFAGLCILFAILSIALFLFDWKYQEKIYPGVLVEGIDFGNKESADVIDYYFSKNIPFEELAIIFTYKSHIATVSGSTLDLGFDATLSAHQAYLIGRGGDSLFSNLSQKISAYQKQINLTPLFRYKENVLIGFLNQQIQYTDIPVQEALFSFQNGRVTSFKPSHDGRKLNIEKTKETLANKLNETASMVNPPPFIVIPLIVETVHPTIATDQTNNFGIKELIGRGESYFRGSIASREYNLTLAASRINGVLIEPGKIFSFNATVGDISAATGYRQAYIIKSGRTVLDDGGGVCQVSTTLFRAILNTGLPILERWAHSYRVAYYEQGGWKPGFDATIYAPRNDLKFKNDTPAHILIQSYVNKINKKLVFELYGTKDGRVVYISDARLWDSRPAPPPLYQEDPTLAQGEQKQVDWAAPGIKSAFDYKVTKEGKEIFSKTFYSNFIPWQAVYLTGPGG